MSRKKIGLIFLAAIVIVIVFVKTFHAGEKSAPVVVAVSPAIQRLVAPMLHFLGTIVAHQGVDVSAECNGKVSQIFFRSGQSVKKGDLLISLENEEYLARLDQSTAKLQLARNDYERYHVLLKKRGISPAEHDKMAAELASAEAEVHYQKAQLNQTFIRAPFDGKAGIVQVNIGQYIASGQPLINLQALSPLFVDFSIPERAVSSLKEGALVEIKIDTVPEKVIKGKVTALASHVDLDTRTLSVRAMLDEAPHFSLYPGMSVEVQISLSRPTMEILVPETAISYGPIGEYVFKIHKNHAEQIKIITRETVGQNRVVLQGLHQGDQVVCAGQIKLHPGAFVKTVPYRDSNNNLVHKG